MESVAMVPRGELQDGDDRRSLGDDSRGLSIYNTLCSKCTYGSDPHVQLDLYMHSTSFTLSFSLSVQN